MLASSDIKDTMYEYAELLTISSCRICWNPLRSERAECVSSKLVRVNLSRPGRKTQSSPGEDLNHSVRLHQRERNERHYWYWWVPWAAFTYKCFTRSLHLATPCVVIISCRLTSGAVDWSTFTSLTRCWCLLSLVQEFSNTGLDEERWWVGALKNGHWRCAPLWREQ